MKTQLFSPCIAPVTEGNVNSRGKSIVNSLLIIGASLMLALSVIRPAMANMAEHTGAQDLVPISAAKRLVVKSGAWSSAATWNDGQIPQAGENVYVPADKTLIADVNSETAVGTVRVDGAINFPAWKNVKLKLDTLVVTENGKFVIGEEKARVSPYAKIEIIIANNGPINRDWDPLNLSRGVILQGKTRIYGTEKSAFHKLAVRPNAGDTQITLDTVPTGWAKGDIIAITSTKFRGKQAGDKSYVTQDELRRIKAISGASIVLGQVDNAATADPLKYGHNPENPDIPVYVANFTRNVVFSGEGGESVPPSQRAHFMVMHAPDTVIKGAGFYYLGRTDKALPIDDFKLDKFGNKIKDENGHFIPGSNNNPRGRYSVHFHHTGTDINTAPVICSGNAVFSSHGWGFVNHTSYVIMENNASYNVYGSHFVSEDGNEIGAFRNNIAIKSEGRNSYSKFGTGNHDVGHTGHGFWLESRNLVMDGNVISGVYNAAVLYMSRNFASGANLMIKRDNLLTTGKEIVKDMPSIWYDKVPLTHEKNTTVIASGGALDVIKANPAQGHDVRSVIDSLKAYEVLNGLGLQYTRKYTLRNVELVASKASVRPWHKGMYLSRQVQDLVLQNVKVNGFVHPFFTGTTFNGKPDETDALFINVSVDDRPVNLATDIHKESNAVIYNYNPKLQKVVNLAAQGAALPGSNASSLLSFKADKAMSGYFPYSYTFGYDIKGIKSDSLGDAPFESHWGYYQLMEAIKKGFYKDSQGTRYVILSDAICDRLTAEVAIINVKLKLPTWYKELGPYLGPLS